ncbi:MAG: cytochrome c [Myxococcota bacterium]|nr:cytochrome c [Myxococcota bacterium]
MQPQTRIKTAQPQFKRFQSALRALALTLALVFPSTGLAQDPEGTIQYRQDLMSAIGSDMAAIADILKFRLPLVANIQTPAANIASNAGLVSSAFKAPVTEGATDAKPEIWKDWAHFEKDIAKMKTAAEKLSQTVAQGGDGAAIGGGMKSLGKTCGGCHKEFRKPKEESYKSK